MNDSRGALDRQLAMEVGGRIRDLRRRAHITQAGLARMIGMRPGPMNLIENGRHVPSGRVLYRLSTALGVPIDEFFPSEPYPFLDTCSPAGTAADSAGDHVPRGLSSRPVLTFLPALETGGDSAAEENANNAARCFLGLEDLCDAMKSALIPLHIHFVATEAGVEQLVCQVRHHLGITNAVVFDYLELMENAGLRVVFLDFPAETQSLAGLDRPNSNAFFFVRRAMNPERQIFRLIFELGRVYWHMRASYASTARCAHGEDLDEAHMARKFAALFLMPAAAVRATVSQLGIGPTAWTYELLLRIKHRFGVSAESFAIRLEELGLIDVEISSAFKQRIREYYSATDWSEPDGSLRRLSYNGRLGDLRVTALSRAGADEEAAAIARALDACGCRVVRLEAEHGKETVV